MVPIFSVNGEPMDLADIDEDVHGDLMTPDEYEAYANIVAQMPVG